MPWLAVSKNGQECICSDRLSRKDASEFLIPGFLNERENHMHGYWYSRDGGEIIILPKGSIRKLIGRDLTWNDEPVKLQ
ncbi:MAG: hypothetical protein WCL43_04985 [Chlorobium sp.]|nr:MAG: fructan hydrolase [Chlorobium sp.]